MGRPAKLARPCSSLKKPLRPWLIAALLILPQSVLLGTTFPLMSAGLARAHPASTGESIAMLYFTNSLGAAAGVLAHVTPLMMAGVPLLFVEKIVPA